MPSLSPANAADVRSVVEERLEALKSQGGTQETETVEWRDGKVHVPVISMPVDLLTYNPATHRIRAQRSTDPVRDRSLDDDPFGATAQAYLHDLLMADPADPSKVDPSFDALKEDLREHGQNDPGIITRAGMLINGNTRRAALKELGHPSMRVGVLPPDASDADLLSIELSLQLRRDHRRDYSFMNFLLTLDEQARSGRKPADIQKDFRMRATTFEQCRWILEFVNEAISRSNVTTEAGSARSLRLVDFETHQGKLEELYRAYTKRKATSPEEAETLRELRLLALILDKSKTDLRLIESDFKEKYLIGLVPRATEQSGAGVKIPGTKVVAKGPSADVQALKQFTTDVLRAKAIELSPGASTPTEAKEAGDQLREVRDAMERALDRAGRQGRILKKRLAAVDRISDAVDDVDLAIAAVAEARTTGNFEPEDLAEVLDGLRSSLTKLAQIVTRGSDSELAGLAWLRSVAQPSGPHA
jgi:hypothetical protein